MTNNRYFLKPESGECASYYEAYIALVKESNLLDALKNGLENTVDFFDNIPAPVWRCRYQPDKWSVKEMMGHLIDTERVFMYRALSIARGSLYELPGFDENEYVQQAYSDLRRGNDLMEEYILVRKSSILFFKSLLPEKLIVSGIANNQCISIRAIAFVLAGHEMHHLRILKERYLN